MRLQTRLATAGFLLATACSDKPYIAYGVTVWPPVGQFSARLASVPVGVVVEFTATIQGGNQNGTLTALVDDPTRATVTPTTTAGQFVLVGLEAGKTTLRVQVDGKEASTVPIEVREQTASNALQGGIAQTTMNELEGGIDQEDAAGQAPWCGPLECKSGGDCFPGEVCCITSSSPQGFCSTPVAWECLAQLCADSTECGDGGACLPMADSGLMACDWRGRP